MNVSMKYGKTGLSLDLPGDIDVTLIQKKAMSVLKDPEGAIKAAFANPVNCKALRDEVKSCRSCCIVPWHDRGCSPKAPCHPRWH